MPSSTTAAAKRSTVVVRGEIPIPCLFSPPETRERKVQNENNLAGIDQHACQWETSSTMTRRLALFCHSSLARLATSRRLDSAATKNKAGTSTIHHCHAWLLSMFVVMVTVAHALHHDHSSPSSHLQTEKRKQVVRAAPVPVIFRLRAIGGVSFFTSEENDAS